MGQIFGILLGAVVLVAIIAIIFAYPFMLIWNYAVVAAIQVANPIEFWQAFWLMVFFSAFVSGSNSGGKE